MTTLNAQMLLEGLVGEPWKFVPWHIAESASQVVAGEGWLICETSCDANARLIASAPRLARRVIELEEAVAAIRGMIAGYAEQPNLPGDIFKIADAALNGEQTA